MRSFVLRSLLAALASVGLPLLAGCGDDDEVSLPTGQPSDLIGMKAPSLSGTNLAGGGQASLATTAGKPTLVVFWLNVCTDCQKAMPEIQALATKLSGKANALSVAIDDPKNGKGEKGYETPADFVRTVGAHHADDLISTEASGPGMAPRPHSNRVRAGLPGGRTKDVPMALPDR